ncbi:hypothetical protein IMSAG049_01329 [Clostridiales bacterium]|nr:hypothetical protein IMSAG049_01329 [Clostridiales bacterium]
MNLEKGDILSGFKLINKEKIEDIRSIGYLFRHERSGAGLMYIENDDDNKVFFISFKTPPEDDCGTAHIVEHSVLCGSEKYPVKDPFNELAKGSLNTYLNALTYSDKTVYPIASRNDKDFTNLMDVYMDSVFNPCILKNREIFMQEGHHLHLEKPDDELEEKGVVYNEMKGAFSEPDRYIDMCVNTSLFPNSPYGFESGGDPEKITELTYEKFIEFYKKYYHPSNCYIYLFGKMDIREKLEYIDKYYLSVFTRQKGAEINHQKPIRETVRRNEKYPVLKKGEDEAYYAVAFMSGDSCNAEKCLGFSILSYMLMDTNASPVRKALLDNKFCADTEGWFDPSMLDTVFTIVAKNAKEDSLDEFEATVMEKLKKLAERGLDSKLKTSAINAFDFMLSEENFGYKPRGLYYGLKAMNSWLHTDTNPFESFRYKKHISAIRAKAEDRYFEKMIEETMLNNTAKVFVSLQPKEGMQTELDETQKKLYAKMKEELSGEELENIINNTANLLEYQSSDDDLSVMPALELNDINKKADIIENEIRDEIFFVPADTNGIVYAEISFDVNHIPESDYGYVGLLSDLVGRLDTEKYSFGDLSTCIDMYTGGIAGICSGYYDTNGNIKRRLSVSTKALIGNVDMMIKLAEQTTMKMLLDRDKSIRLIIRDRITRLEDYLAQNGHMTAATRALGHFSAASAFKDATSGVGYFKFLSEIDKNFDDNVIKKLKKTAKAVFTGPLIAISCGEKEFSKAIRIKTVFTSRDMNDAISTQDNGSPYSEGIITAGKIQYVAKAMDYKKLGYGYSGKLLVLKNIINLEYLWNSVRVQGGAYGCGCNFNKNGSMYMYSYRDPNLERTLKIYGEAGEFLRNFKADKRSMTNYIIGAINSIDAPRTKEQSMKLAFTRHIMGITPDMQQQERNELLSSTADDMTGYAQMLDEFEKSQDICVVGNGNRISSCKILDEVMNLK